MHFPELGIIGITRSFCYENKNSVQSFKSICVIVQNKNDQQEQTVTYG